MEIGVDSFAAAYDDSSLAVSPATRVRELVEQIAHADQVGLDVFGIGEHHRREYLDSAPAMILAAAAVRTEHARAPGRDRVSANVVATLENRGARDTSRHH